MFRELVVRDLILRGAAFAIWSGINLNAFIRVYSSLVQSPANLSDISMPKNTYVRDVQDVLDVRDVDNIGNVRELSKKLRIHFLIMWIVIIWWMIMVPIKDFLITHHFSFFIMFSVWPWNVFVCRFFFSDPIIWNSKKFGGGEIGGDVAPSALYSTFFSGL